MRSKYSPIWPYHRDSESHRNCGAMRLRQSPQSQYCGCISFNQNDVTHSYCVNSHIIYILL
ncbi:hypothetical protein Lalb_Chr20g0115091 [Lupinus albus]|uniref:Uncharacterized protein n=1 Tax=Lupinus albus TaxID=3870 RepID=A0A6A4NXA1_LUPAL|nr:hypothetical protein Lalb_Chr20g0115091 [Lupinus albus]